MSSLRNVLIERGTNGGVDPRHELFCYGDLFCVRTSRKNRGLEEKTNSSECCLMIAPDLQKFVRSDFRTSSVFFLSVHHVM